MKQIIDYQKKSLDLISKSIGLPIFDELLEDPYGDFIDKETKASEEIDDEYQRRIEEGDVNPIDNGF